MLAEEVTVETGEQVHSSLWGNSSRKICRRKALDHLTEQVKVRNEEEGES